MPLKRHGGGVDDVLAWAGALETPHLTLPSPPRGGREGMSYIAHTSSVV
jgi:hypothetical protein